MAKPVLLEEDWFGGKLSPKLPLINDRRLDYKLGLFSQTENYHRTTWTHMLHTKLHVTAEKCILRGPALQNCLGTHIVHPCFAQHPRCTHCMVLFHTAAWAHTLYTPAMHNILGTHSAWPCFIQQPGHTLLGPVPLNSFSYLFSPHGTVLTSFANLLLALWWLLLAVSLVLLTSQWLNCLSEYLRMHLRVEGFLGT